ncbi:MAG TPA: helix-turn-helix domain-containing protein [Rhodanobacteraceae bacterium]
METKLFDQLLRSVSEMDEIVHGERAPSREFAVDGLKVKDIRRATGLSQAHFAALLDVRVSTLQNWEQGRRAPTGPARSLLRLIDKMPTKVVHALVSQ